MPIPTPVTRSGAAGLAAILADPGRILLAFDYDGVLSPIVDDPDQAPPDPRAIAALVHLAPHVGSIAVITGRRADVVVSYCRFADEPALSGLVALLHGPMTAFAARPSSSMGPRGSRRSWMDSWTRSRPPGRTPMIAESRGTRVAPPRAVQSRNASPVGGNRTA